MIVKFSRSHRIRRARQAFSLADFTAISAVEGIRLTESMRRELEDFEKNGVPDEKRRRMIKAKYGKKSDRPRPTG